MTFYKTCYFLFIIGGIGYSLIEILWRGYTHPSMGVLGGICLIAIWFISYYLRDEARFIRAFFCALIITSLEFISGVFLNIVLKLNVWDYSQIPLNFIGQVCLPYSLLWFLLSYFVIYIMEKLFFAQKKSTE